MVGIGWAVQIASGVGFGAVSYYFYDRLPDIHGVAVAALAIKVTCAVSGLGLAVISLSRGDRWTDAKRRFLWRALAFLAITALAAAAFLRWFS